MVSFATRLRPSYRRRPVSNVASFPVLLAFRLGLELDPGLRRDDDSADSSARKR